MKKILLSALALALVAIVAVGCAAQKPQPTALPPTTAEAAQTAETTPTEAPTLAPTAVVTPSPSETAASAAPAVNQGEPQLALTLAQLAQYNGKDGQPAYVAVDGVIYDVTNSPQWIGGSHKGYQAGQDLTDAIKNKSPHGVAKLVGIPIVGKLIP